MTPHRRAGRGVEQVRSCGSLVTSWPVTPARLCVQVRMASVVSAWESSRGALSWIRSRLGSADTVEGCRQLGRGVGQ